MTASNGIKINGVHSYTDFGLYISARDIGVPERKTNQVSIPYMSGYYDFSAITGEVYYGSRSLVYTFDVLADDEESVEVLKNEIISWAMTAVESNIYDDADPDYYFIGSYASASYKEDGDLPDLGGQLTLTFTAQPYRYSRETGEGVI